MTKENHTNEENENLTYEEKLLAVFKNFIFSGYDPYIVPILPLEADTKYFSSIFTNGCLYRQISFILNKDLSLNEYCEIYNTLDKRLQDEHLVFSYNDTDLVRVEDYYEGERCSQYVYPLFGPCIRFDIKLAASSN